VLQFELESLLDQPVLVTMTFIFIIHDLGSVHSLLSNELHVAFELAVFQYRPVLVPLAL
jgi:hypothetical protein